jgi:hypothetical protein
MNFKKSFKAIAVMLGMALSFSLVSCGDDDPGDDKSGRDTETYYLFSQCTVNLPQTYYDFCDVVATYTDTDGTTKTKTLTADDTWSTSPVDYDNAPKNYSFKVVATLKANYPEIVPDSAYAVGKNCYMNFFKYTAAEANDTKLAFQKLASGSGSHNVSGATLIQYLQKRPSLIDRTINIETGVVQTGVESTVDAAE